MDPEPKSHTYDKDRWQRALSDIAVALGSNGPPVHLCLIGSASCVLSGMDGRTSRDLDVWKPASDYDLLELKHAVESAGLLFDPKSHLEPDKPYLRIIESFPDTAKERATENLVYLEILQ